MTKKKKTSQDRVKQIAGILEQTRQRKLKQIIKKLSRYSLNDLNFFDKLLK